jgi:hypothetical protein
MHLQLNSLVALKNIRGLIAFKIDYFLVTRQIVSPTSSATSNPP